MTGDQARERHLGDLRQRFAPAVRAGGIHERHDIDDEVADDRDLGAWIVEPDVPFGRRELREVDVERPPGDGHPARFRDHMIGPDALGMIDHRPPADQLVARRGGGLGIGEHLVGVGAAVLEEGRQRALERVARVDIDVGIGLADVPIAGRMVEMPVAVDDRRDRPVPRLGIIEDLLRMLGVAAGIEHDQAPGRVEDDGVAVRAAVERHRAGDQMIGLGRPRGPGKRQQNQGSQSRAHKSPSPAAEAA